MTPPPAPFAGKAWFANPVFLAGLIVAAGLLAYGNSLSGPFVFDDQGSIVANDSIRRLAEALRPPQAPGLTVAGRPVLNLSLAIDYAIGGPRVWSYHATNLAIHLLAGLTLFGIMRRTAGRDKTVLAFLVALLWTVHPLQTEAVTYIVQRAESLMGLFYLLTLYCFIRHSDETLARSATGSIESNETRRIERSGTRKRFVNYWAAGSVACCLLGVATKEVMVSAPVIVFLYDRTFVSGTFREAWRKHRGYYLALAATWLLLLKLVMATGGNRGGSVGFGAHVSWMGYILTQFPAIAHYLRLAFWPYPLVFDYGTFWATHPAKVIPSALLVLGLVVSTLWALRFRPALGFLGAFFFSILAPTSLLPGTTQMIVEHRMYLPLAAVLVAVVFLTHAAAGRKPALFWVAAAAAAAGLIVATHRRNADYHTELSLWADTVAHRPGNVTARDSFGNALKEAGRIPEAVAEYQAALQIEPGNAAAHNNLGGALRQAGRIREAKAEFETAVRLDPNFAEAHNNLGSSLDEESEPEKAMAEFEAALRIQSRYAEAENNLGMVLAETGRNEESAAHYEAALRLRPDYAEAHNNLGNLQSRIGRPAEAIAEYQAALRLRPEYPEARNNLGTVLAQTGRTEEAIAQLQAALRLRPGYVGALNNLGNTLDQAGRVDEAIVEFQAALRFAPGDAGTHYNLGLELERAGRLVEARDQFETALRLAPNFPQARTHLEELGSPP